VFVSLEGIDGAGKSTQVGLLADALGSDTIKLREPGGTEVGERLRKLLKSPDLELSPNGELFMFLAARAELVERVIRPALDEGRHIVSDRFLDSTVAYQGAGRELGTEFVEQLNARIVGRYVPDKTILLRVDSQTAVERSSGRPLFGEDPFERAAEEFRLRVAEAFDEIASRDPERVIPVDAAGDVRDVHREICSALGIEPVR
jgi:dTMP kinase